MDLEGSGRGVIEVTSRNSPGGIEEINKTLQSEQTVSWTRFGPRTSRTRAKSITATQTCRVQICKLIFLQSQRSVKV
jgi:hypothetical protein